MTADLQLHGKPTVYTPEMAEIKAIHRLTDRENLFTIALPNARDLNHQPGQFVGVSVLGSGEAPISISSPPTQKGIFELCVRSVGLVTNDLHLKMSPGTRVGIRGPFGRGFDLAEFTGKDILYVAGGLGLAPLRSLIKTTLDPEWRSRFGKITILYGAKTPAELLFTKELREWAARSDVTCLVTVDRPDESWRGHSGVITTLFKKMPKLRPSNTIAAVVGPPVMYKFVILELLILGISESRIKVSLERRMKCGIGKCGHCQINGMYVCRKGPVFSYSDVKNMREAIH